ncbi:hypothetical protein HZL00_24455, partial [Enterobacter hormaechei]|nr:hypothetical protein [Enterobacter hormaechei]NYA79508.1 hypothetical protein [Enterobacter hormaechei]
FKWYRQKVFNHLYLSVVANVVSLRQMPDTSYQLARFKVIGYTIGVVGYLNFAVVL